MSERIIGIMGAMPEEINGVVELLADRQDFLVGMRTYYTGKINGIRTIVVFSRWGKVAAATTVAHLVLKFNITELIFTGVAGAINHNLKIGDIVIAKRLIQHDMDARPLMQQFEVPLLGITFFECNETEIMSAEKAVNILIERNHLYSVIGKEALMAFGITLPTLYVGDIASGDQFFSDNADKYALQEKLPSVLCVEMEGAAVAQVCFEYDIPFSIIRTISDVADENAPINFPSFINSISSKYSVEIIKSMLGFAN